MSESACKVFLLSPASCSGKRAGLLLDPRSSFELARRLRSPEGISIGEAFSFMSGLYFRGKLAYARSFATPPDGFSGAEVITPGMGLLSADVRLTQRELRRIAAVKVDVNDPAYVEPLRRDAERLSGALQEDGRAVLLGSLATDKYLGPLRGVLGDKLLVPVDFVGRGDMSRGGLLLRCVDSGEELTYVATAEAPRRGKRPPRLPPRRS